MADSDNAYLTSCPTAGWVEGPIRRCRTTLLLASLFLFIPLTVHAEDLGNFSANAFDANSIANPFGASSPYSSNSVTNEFGIYGSPCSNQFATNPYATDAPHLSDPQGHDRGELSMTPYAPNSVSIPYGRYGVHAAPPFGG